MVHSNDDSLADDEERTQNARPVFHWAPHRIHAHIAITVLSLLLERAIEHDCQDTWRNIRDDLKQIQLAQLSSPNGNVWQVADPGLEAGN